MTAEQCIKEANEGYPLRTVIDNLTDEQIIEAIQGYGKYWVQEALKSAAQKANTKAVPNSTYKGALKIIDKESILNSFDLSKIR